MTASDSDNTYFQYFCIAANLMGFSMKIYQLLPVFFFQSLITSTATISALSMLGLDSFFELTVSVFPFR